MAIERVEDCICIKSSDRLEECSEVIKRVCKEHPGYEPLGSPVWDKPNYVYKLFFVKYKDKEFEILKG